MLRYLSRDPRGALILTLAIFSALTAVLATPVVHIESAAAALLARGSLHAGEHCNASSDCYSQLCRYNICHLQPAGGPCFEKDNCYTKSCSFPKGSQNGTCTPNKTPGGRCYTDAECTTGERCDGDGICSVPGPLRPAEPCSNSTQCVNGLCSDFTYQHDKYGDSTNVYLNDLKPGSYCDYLALGSSGCRSNFECSSGVCSNGVCTLVSDGSKCLFNAQCAQVCSLNGTCITPSDSTLAPGQPCSNSAQCLSQNCGTFKSKLTRPTLDRKGNVTLGDLICDPSDFNGPCHSDNDCIREAACLASKDSSTGFTCQTLDVGQPCSRDRACKSGFCSSKTKTCDLPSTGAKCSANDACFSGSCKISGACYGPDSDKYCPNSSCNPASKGGSCRISKDCDTSKGLKCTKSKCA